MHAMIVVAVYYACKISTMYMCVHVCVQVCVCMCASTMFMCVHVSVHDCQCVFVCVHVHFAQISYSHCIQAQRVTIAAVSLSLILASSKYKRRKIRKRASAFTCACVHI